MTWEKCGGTVALKGPDWDNDVDLESVEDGEEGEEDGESMVDRSQQVIESPLWVLARLPDIRRCSPLAHNGNKMEYRQIVYGPFAEFLLNKGGKDGKDQVCDTITDNSVDLTMGFSNLAP